MIVECLRVVDRGVLAPGIGVMNQLDIGARRPLMQSHPQRVEDERGAHVAANCQPTILRL